MHSAKCSICGSDYTYYDKSFTTKIKLESWEVKEVPICGKHPASLYTIPENNGENPATNQEKS